MLLKTKGFCCERLVLPDRIELSTSPLPMECSTTELRQHARTRESASRGPAGRPILATRSPAAQARDAPGAFIARSAAGSIRRGRGPCCGNGASAYVPVIIVPSDRTNAEKEVVNPKLDSARPQQGTP
jgi:hypothetical protein